jgi:hypothetical protein
LALIDRAGHLDRGFGDAGFAVVDASDRHLLVGSAPLVMADGSIALALQETSSSGEHLGFEIVRWSASGSIDSDFASRGKAAFQALAPGSAYGLLQMGNHDVLLAGTVGSANAVARFADAGDLLGIARVPVPVDRIANGLRAIAATSDGFIAVGEVQSRDGDRTIDHAVSLALDERGEARPESDTGVAPQAPDQRADAVAVDRAGRIWIAGTLGTPGHRRVVVARRLGRQSDGGFGDASPPAEDQPPPASGF